MQPEDLRKAAENASLEYIFEIAGTPSISLKISLEVAGEPDGTTNFSLCDGEAAWAGLAACADDVHDISITNASGKSLKIERRGPERWFVSHEPSEKLLFSYRFLPSGNAVTGERDSRLRPIVSEDLVHFIGHVGLIYPKYLQNGKKRPIRFSWRGLDASGFKAATSYGNGGNGAELYETLSVFRHGLFMAGNFRLHERKIHGAPVTVAISGVEWLFTDEKLVNIAVRIIEIERAFFNDFDYPAFLIGLIPVRVKAGDPAFIDAANLKNAFALAMSADVNLNSKTPEHKVLMSLLAHETFHTWNGGKIGWAHRSEAIYWFLEGFTNHYARSFLLSSGLFTIGDFAEDLNKTISDYWLSPYRDTPNGKIGGEMFWENPEFHNLPYLRGDILAFLLDHEIRKASGERRKLDDFMRELLALVTENGRKVDNDLLFGLIETNTSPAFANKFRRLVDDGGRPEFPPSLLSPCFKLQFIEKSRIETVSDSKTGGLRHRPKEKPILTPQFIVNEDASGECR